MQNDGIKNHNPLIDPFGRAITYLRLSVTDRCNLRCTYCMAEDMQFFPKQDVLSLEEMLEVAEAFTELGVSKIRLTGGEPLVRNNVSWLIEQLGSITGLSELTLTSNGVLLDQYAATLYEAGIRRINVSLDSLDKTRFEEITRFGKLDDVLQGLQSAKNAGFKIKLNSVILQGVNDQDVTQLVDYSVENGFDISFIEEMPLGEISSHNRGDTVVFSERVKETLRTKYELVADTYTTGGPSRYQQIIGSDTRVGFISPHSNNFCASCNRVRVTATGKLLLCLGHENAVDLRAVLREDSYTREQLQQVIRNAINKKPEKHEFKTDETHIVRFMNMTGG